MLSSFSDNTIKQYNTTLKIWWTFCQSKNIDVFNPPISAVLSFLTQQFSNGCSYSTLNSHRSAIAAVVGNNIGSDERVKRLLKGAFKLKGPKPKYSSTWDPQLVLNLVGSWFPNNTLSLENITKKLVSLLAICTAHRVQTLSLIKLENIHFSQNGIKINILDIIKTSAPDRDQPILFLPYFSENKSICPATVLSDYISMTKNIRPEENAGKLFLTFKKPHKSATTQTISRWIKQVLEKSGIDIKMFSAHSTRHASTSAAYAGGVNIETIRKAAGWTNSSNSFTKFYNRIVTDEGSFARSILSNNIAYSTNTHT